MTYIHRKSGIIPAVLTLFVLFACEKSNRNETFECSFVSPVPNEILANETQVQLTITASHDIEQVKFLINDEIIGSVRGVPSTLTWIPKFRSGGVHTLKAIVDPIDFDDVELTMPVIFRYQVGELAQGGTIFKVDDSGNHGMAVAPEDLIYKSVKDIAWGPEDFIGATDTVNGQENTKILANAGLPSDYLWNAFKFDYLFNGYQDWYVPSKTEMLFLMEFASGSGSMLNMQATYWTSTECCRANACAVDFAEKKAIVTLKADSLFRIRPIRKF